MFFFHFCHPKSKSWIRHCIGSRHSLVCETSSTSNKAVIPKLEVWFSMFGYPEFVKTDNGPPFNSAEFTLYCKNHGIKHVKITPKILSYFSLSLKVGILHSNTLEIHEIL